MGSDLHVRQRPRINTAVEAGIRVRKNDSSPRSSVLALKSNMSFIASAAALLGVVGAAQARGAGSSLDPVQPVLLPDGALAENPLAHLGGNGPWTAGECLAPNSPLVHG